MALLLITAAFVESRLILGAEYAVACKNWTGIIPSENCTRIQHPFLWKVTTDSGVHHAEEDLTSAAAAKLFMMHYFPIGMPDPADPSLLAFAHLNETHQSFVNLGPNGQTTVQDYGWPRLNWFPSRLVWSTMGATRPALLEWSSFRSCGTRLPYCNLTKELFSTVIPESGAATPELLWRWTNESNPIPPPPPEKSIGYFMALDDKNQKLYSQPEPGSLISVFDVAAKAFDAPIANEEGADLLCLFYDPTHAAGSLGALVALNDGAHSFSLVAVDLSTGKQQRRATAPALPAGVMPVRNPASAPMCSFSPASGVLSMLLGSVDPSSPRGMENKELWALEADTRDDQPSIAVVKVGVGNIGPAEPGKTWRLVNPFLKHSD